ncbi:YfhO family protein [Desemzia sp. RIT804]|uniref:YfhO family protein n=1 Tax=Desemzia sp. RIT 804 TaxID=2810209 RepID=UPI00195170EB|nr:YfhO family protein [Desemzia sp. RIT 804]MBM6614231.1 YfhO family protein [Desemzia sp. RIT 804]
MKNRILSFIQKQWPLLLAFTVPFLIMSGIHAFKGVYPFGNETVLTIDLGQQYVDFLAYYRQTLLEDPTAFFYSFTKAIGGDMVGLWAYYLASPFNLIFLLFPQSQVSLAVTVVTMLKYGLAGWSFAYLLKKEFDGEGFSLVAFSTSYALMGYTIVNQFNIMWLDGVIFLPLIVLGLERLIKQQKGVLYTVFLAICLMSNYYIAYMICFFLVLYFIFRCISIGFPTIAKRKDKVLSGIKTSLLFIWHSLLAGGISAILLLPTLHSLMVGKASYIKMDFKWESDYFFPEMVSKFFVGAFNFDQMPSGYPNLFIGSLALLCFCLYFFNRIIPLRERVTAFVLMIFFIFSMNVDAMNKIWHAMQYPNWYPYRFSFVVSFFLLLLAFRSFTHLKGVNPLATFFTMIIASGIGLYVYSGEFDFLTPIQIIITLLFTFLVLLLLILKPQHYKWLGFVLFLVTSIEMTVNASISLSRLSYVDQDTFSVYQQSQQQVIDWIENYDDDLYRIEKTFVRTKNDSFQAGFNGITHFSSTFESAVPDLFGRLGNPVGGGFLTYSNGTLLTDALFGVKYYASEQNALYWKENEDLPSLIETTTAPLKQNNFRYDTFQTAFSFPFRSSNKDKYHFTLKQTKPDLKDYQKIAATNQVIVYENPYSLPFAFGSSSNIESVYLQKNRPIQAQESVLSALAGSSNATTYFFSEEFSSTIYQNVLLSGSSFEPIIEKDNEDSKASVQFQFTPETNDAYYVTVGSSIGDKDVNLYLNGESFAFYDSSNETVIHNLANEDYNKTITFEIELLDDSISLEDIQLYRLDTTAFTHSIESLQAGGMVIENHSHTQIEGTVTIQDNQDFLMTSIPFSEGWSVSIDGVPVQPEEVIDSLLGVPIQSGKHRVVFSYSTPYLFEGIIITVISILLLLIPFIFKKINL